MHRIDRIQSTNQIGKDTRFLNEKNKIKQNKSLHLGGEGSRGRQRDHGGIGVAEELSGRIVRVVVLAEKILGESHLNIGTSRVSVRNGGRHACVSVKEHERKFIYPTKWLSFIHTKGKVTVGTGVLVGRSGRGAVVIIVRENALVRETASGGNHLAIAAVSTVEVGIDDAISRSRCCLKGAKVGRHGGGK